jgi:hypothetical protein
MYRSVNILATATESEQSPCNFRRPKLYHSTSPFAIMLNPASYQHGHQMAPHSHQLHDPVYSTRAQQQYYLPQFYVSQAAQYQVGARLRSLHEQTEPPRTLADHHAYSLSRPGLSLVNIKSSSQQFPMGYYASGSYANLGKIRRSLIAWVHR